MGRLQVTGMDHMALAASPDDVIELDDENAISQRPNHYTFRTDFLRAALDRLQCVQTGEPPWRYLSLSSLVRICFSCRTAEAGRHAASSAGPAPACQAPCQHALAPAWVIYSRLLLSLPDACTCRTSSVTTRSLGGASEASRVAASTAGILLLRGCC